MQAQFETHIQNHFPFLKEGKVLVACSGGLDSVVLAHLCNQAGMYIALAHCNFKLRGDESDGDEEFVRELAETLEVEVHKKSFDTVKYAEENRGSIQMAARKLRYDWFEELMEAHGFQYVLTAHHADDALETFLINLSRGTGIDGLSGIQAQNGNVIRPLLPFSRQAILDFAQKEHLEWREDSSNEDTKYLRNKIRHQLVPKLKELHPTFLQNFGVTQEHLNHSRNLISNYIDSVRADLFEERDDEIRINIENMLQLRPLESHLYELFKEYGFVVWEDTKALSMASSGKELHSKTHRLLKDRSHLILSKNGNAVNQKYWIVNQKSLVKFPVPLKFEHADSIENSSPQVIFVDKEKLNYPLLLRKWEKGDYFYPFGMQGKKKLSKFFKDEKMDVFSKEKQWLLCSGDAIVWVLGKRLDERFKVETTTQQILKISLLV
ncbi:tRNA lysidine(34) synthetase TilS [Flagellimonas algicola]|uniref:tRNA(Ile)-lysidine synthase n=1 Tax=Flagellimonas algicola TaxID=2583815 RepID=A0ABY2WPP9_9FLAO|nr:tRNA lysidine(34) synthetase TilS [Allomuricauda algicola]TMU56710.1 tRNA lysidine(34) synthetase TilS [Allomuricauda algicola]